MGISPPSNYCIVFINSVSFLKAKEETILSNKRRFSTPEDQLEIDGLLFVAAVNNVSQFGGT